MPTTAAVIIGNEILTGKFTDENGPYLVRRFRELGADLLRMAVVRDDVADIAHEVRLCAGIADLVVTSGGVGPTHDDVTLEGVARAFDEPLHLSEPMLELMMRFGLADDEATRRMARIPVGADLVWDVGMPFPVVCCHDVFVLPGIPTLFRGKFETIAHRFAGTAVATARLHTREREMAIAARIGEVQSRFPQVDIGSYPRPGEVGYRVIVTLESRDAAAVHDACAALRALIEVVDPP